MDPVSNSGTITGAGTVGVASILGLNTALVIVQGTWTGTIGFEGKLGSSDWVPVNFCDINQLAGQTNCATSSNGSYKFPVSGFDQFRAKGETVSSTASIFMSAVQGVEVVQEVLSYSFVTMASDSAALAVHII